jgi:hypothetical protein
VDRLPSSPPHGQQYGVAAASATHLRGANGGGGAAAQDHLLALRR